MTSGGLSVYVDEMADEPSYEEHLEWCKQRALELCGAGDVPGAWTSFVSDMSKHPKTRQNGGVELGSMLLVAGHNSTPDEMRKFIEGFN